MKNFIRFLDKRLEEVIISILMGYFVVASILQIFMRFVVQMPAAWTEETARYSFIWMMFVGAAAAVKKRSHIRIDALENAIKSEKAKAGLKLFSEIVFLVFTLATTAIGVMICARMMNTVQVTPVLEISYFYVYLSMPVGMGLASFRIIQTLIRDHTGKGAIEPKDDDGEVYV